jgi:hypothetical protein
MFKMTASPIIVGEDENPHQGFSGLYCSAEASHIFLPVFASRQNICPNLLRV